MRKEVKVWVKALGKATHSLLQYQARLHPRQRLRSACPSSLPFPHRPHLAQALADMSDAGGRM